MQNKFAWISTPDELWEDKKEMRTTALESGIDHVLDLDDIEQIRKLGNVKIIANRDDADIYLVGINGEGDGFLDLKDDFTDSADIASAKKAKSEGKTVCAYIKIIDKAHEQLAVKLGPIVDYIILVGTDWTIIPLENIIADLQKVDVNIIAAVRDLDGAKVALETFEHGTDGVIFLCIIEYECEQDCRHTVDTHRSEAPLIEDVLHSEGKSVRRLSYNVCWRSIVVIQRLSTSPK